MFERAQRRPVLPDSTSPTRLAGQFRESATLESATGTDRSRGTPVPPAVCCRSGQKARNQHPKSLILFVTSCKLLKRFVLAHLAFSKLLKTIIQVAIYGGRGYTGGINQPDAGRNSPGASPASPGKPRQRANGQAHSTCNQPQLLACHRNSTPRTRVCP